MNRIRQRLNDVTKLPSVLGDVQHHLQYHTETGFTTEEANGYAQQLDDIEKLLVPAWEEKLGDTPYEVVVDCMPNLGGFLKIKVIPGGGSPVEVFAESYGHFNSEMCDGSCYQYVYQKVLCYAEGLASGRVGL